MNSKIPVSKIAGLTAHKAGVDQSVALQFIKDLFVIIEEGLCNGETVTIESLGTFSKSLVSGEPIAFYPDPEFADDLNEAFSAFVPVELHDDVTDTMLDEIRTEEAVDTTRSTEIPANVTEPPEVDKEVLHEEPAVLPAVTPEVDTVNEQEKSNTVQSDAASTVMEVPAPEPEPAEDEVPPELPSDIEEEASATATEQPDIAEEEVEYVTVRHRKSRFGIGFVLGLIIGVALGVIGYIAYLVHVLQIPVENLIGY